MFYSEQKTAIWTFQATFLSLLCSQVSSRKSQWASFSSPGLLYLSTLLREIFHHLHITWRTHGKLPTAGSTMDRWQTAATIKYIYLTKIKFQCTASLSAAGRSQHQTDVRKIEKTRLDTAGFYFDLFEANEAFRVQRRRLGSARLGSASTRATMYGFQTVWHNRSKCNERSVKYR